MILETVIVLSRSEHAGNFPLHRFRIEIRFDGNRICFGGGSIVKADLYSRVGEQT